MNILLASGGVSIKFKEYDDLSQGLSFYFALCNEYPEHTFWFVGLSDISELPQEKIPANMRYIPKRIYKADDICNVKFQVYNYLKENAPEFDLAIIHKNYDYTLVVADLSFNTLERGKFALYTIAKMKIPYVKVIDDAMTFGRATDSIDCHAPICFLSQYNGIYNKTVFDDLDKVHEYIKDNPKSSVKALKEKFAFTKWPVPIKYSKVEQFFLIGKKKVNFMNFDKTEKWFLAARLNPVRVKEYNKWFGKNSPFKGDVTIYAGTVNTEANDQMELKTIKKKFPELQHELWHSKYSFISQNQTNTTEFVTQKFWDMVYHGIIPFFDKNMYDTANLLDAPDFCKVSTPEELYERVEWFENTPEEYEAALETLYEMIPEERFSSHWLHEIFDEIICDQ